MDNFIASLAGKSIYISSGATYDFIDSGSTSLTRFSSIDGAKTIDLNSLRQSVKNGDTVASSFANLMQAATGAKVLTSKGVVTGLEFSASVPGLPENNTKIGGVKGDLSHYNLDFTKSLGHANISNWPQYLDNKGFRVYCATCNNQWFNLEFINGLDTLQNRPKSGGNGNDIHAIIIDVSKVTDVSSLVKAIYEQGTKAFDKINHNLNLAMDAKKGILTVYDARMSNLKTLYGPYYQEKGAKIANGILDNVVLRNRKIEVKRLYIQDTAKSSLNIKIDIPNITLSNIFGFIPSDDAMQQYTVLTRENREHLLGKAQKNGVLDDAVLYLTDANELIGAQINHLMSSRKNIITAAHENTTSSLATIKDANMAREMTAYVKNNILAQAAQAMLTHANQDSETSRKLLFS